jgi:dephospho-CoA kinase
MYSIIGIAGTLASGKDTVAHYLVKKYGFMHVSTGDIIRDEIRNRGLEINRSEEFAVGTNMRTKNGPAILSKIAIERYENSIQKQVGVAISGIRNPAEGELILSKGGIVIFVDADPKTRFNRLQARGRIGAEVSFRQFMENEEKELSSNNPASQNINMMRVIATYVVKNDGTEEELFNQIDAIAKDSLNSN